VRLAVLFLLASTGSLAAEPAAPAPAAAGVPASEWNVLVLTMDAWRPDRMALYGHDRDTTPYLDRFASESVVFERAFATGAWTSPGIASAMTGLHAPAHGQNTRFDYTDDTLVTPLDVLAAHGWWTTARDNESAAVRGLGFEYAYRPAVHEPDEIADLLNGHRSKWVAWVHLKDTHLPYDPPPYHLKRFGGDRLDTPAIRAVRQSGTVYPKDYGLSWRPPVIPSFTAEEQAVVRDLYDGAVAAADDTLGRFIERLRAAGTLDRTLLILTADHGEELFDHGWVGHASTGYEGKAYDELIHIPLIVRVPGGGLVGRTDALVQQHDFMPTVFELLGQDPAQVDGGFQGRSLVPLLRGEAGGHELVYARTTFKGWTTPLAETGDGMTAVRSADRKLIAIKRGSRVTYEGYDLATDPGETQDLYATAPERFADLRAALGTWEADNRAHAAGLAFTAAERRLEGLRQAADSGDAVAAAGHWTALMELQRTYATEWAPPLEHASNAAKWAKIVQQARRLRDRASR
jgi:arylsulfatase A-like enzyme